jgi:hypothetical protein
MRLGLFAGVQHLVSLGCGFACSSPEALEDSLAAFWSSPLDGLALFMGVLICMPRSLVGIVSDGIDNDHIHYQLPANRLRLSHRCVGVYSMNIITLDFETYFDDEYNLKKMTTEAYIRDPRFEVLVAGIRFPDGHKQCVTPDDIRWMDCVVLCHHAHFDGLILSHHYGIRPWAWLDTLSMARLMLGNHIPGGLGALAKHFNFEDKAEPYDLFRGKRFCDLVDTPSYSALSHGCLQHCELTYQIYEKLATGFPQEAYALIDATIRMFTEPKLLGDVNLLEKERDNEIYQKGKLLTELGVTKKEIGSNATFIKLLAAEGVEVEYKEGKNGPIPAFAKTDAFMDSLCNSDNDRVNNLAIARLSSKSTINETRAGRILEMARRGPLPIYLAFAAAQTTRWGGGDKVNFQNLPRSGAIRHALGAPPGCVIAKVDAKQQECRLLNTAAGQEDILWLFRENRDVYKELANWIYHTSLDEITPDQRQVAKITELACGYGVGAKKLFAQMRAKKVPGAAIELAVQAVNAYRASHQQVVNLWNHGNELITWLGGGKGKIDAPFGLPLDIRDGKIILPNGFPMHYELEWDDGAEPDWGSERDSERVIWSKPGWKRKTRNGWTRIYGAALVENIFQALGAVAIGQSVLRIKERIGLLPTLLEHDAGAWIVPEKMIDQVMPILIEEVGRAPSWLPQAPMDAEGTYGERYG